MSQLSFLDPDRVFSIGSGLAMLCWLALALSPAGASWAPRVRFVAGRAVPLLLALVYVMFGPAGLLAFAGVRLLWLRRHPGPVLA